MIKLEKKLMNKLKNNNYFNKKHNKIQYIYILNLKKIKILIIVVNVILKVIFLHYYHNYVILLMIICVISLYKLKKHARESTIKNKKVNRRYYDNLTQITFNSLYMRDNEKNNKFL